jgi:hypothetical protein
MGQLNNAARYSENGGQIEIKTLTLPSPIGMGEGATESIGDFRLPILDSLKSARSGNFSNDVKETGKHSETPGEGSIQQSKIENHQSKILDSPSPAPAGEGRVRASEQSKIENQKSRW